MRMSLLETKGLSKYFGGIHALEGVDIAVEQGEIRGLIGPNGSGKTTFLNVVTGLLPITEGGIYFDGKAINGRKPHVITKLGISCTFQIPRILPDMTCLENVMLGSHCRRGLDLRGTFLRIPFVPSAQEEGIRQRALELLEFVGLSGFADRLGRELSWVEEQLLQLARALASEPKLLLLDEPTAGMGDAESRALQAVITKVQAAAVTCVVIAHDMRLIMEICDRISVLSFGKKIAEGTCQEVQTDPAVSEAYLGRD